MPYRWLAGYVAVLLVCATLALGVHETSRHDETQVLAQLKASAQYEAQIADEKMEDALRQIYQNIRTISFLPGVRKLDRHATDPNADAIASIRHIYDNLASNIAVSEVYVVPADFDPDALDPVTNELEAPILSFDGRIVNGGAGASADLAVVDGQAEEVEIHEYRQLREQQIWLKEHYPTTASFSNLDVPVLSGSEVITCDNTVFNTTRSDADRQGIILSVPFYGLDGNLKGTISAITRTKAFQAMLPAQHAALINLAHAYHVLGSGTGQEQASSQFVDQAIPDPGLIFSTVLPIELNDPQSQWQLWFGYPNAHFTDSLEMHGVRNFRIVGYAFSALLTVLCLGALFVLQRSFTALRLSNERLDRNQRRFRSLVQNASDLVLICTPAAKVAYQSPTTHPIWGYASGELLDQSLMALIHPTDDAALRVFWTQAREAPGTTRATELRLRDTAGCWHYVELILTNLVHEPAVNGIVVTIHDIGERKAFEQQLMQQAFYDKLTELPNRALLRDRLDQALVRTGRRQNSVGLIFVDLDNFKLVNDSLGHHVGDELLVEAARRLQACVRSEDTVARLGGDEFVVLLEHLVDEEDARPVADAITEQFALAFTLGDRDVVVTASIGIALGDASGEGQADSLLRNADLAMYRAKTSGKGRYVFFDPSMHTDTLEQLELIADLRCALERGELRLHYQPIVGLHSEHITEVEALVRWQHPTRGLIAPVSFISIAEENGLIVPIGLWVLETACRQTAAWHAQFPGRPPLVVGVNLSPVQFQMPNLAGEVARTLRETGLPARCLKLEITEGTIMQDVEATISILTELKSLGIQLAIDDFGTGYSSLAYLKRLPLDVLKIDGSFVKGVSHNVEDRAIVQAILSLAKALDLTVTAEGIENAEQADALSAWACDRGQGYYFSRPVDGAATTELLQAGLPQVGEERAAIQAA